MGDRPESASGCVNAEQTSYLAELCGVWNLKLSQKDEAEEILRLISLMSDNVHREGVLCWERSYPLVSFHVVQPWLQAKDHAIRLYGVIGREAWEIARKDLCNNINFAQAMLRLEARL